MKKLFTLILTVIMAVACCLGLTACGKELTGFDIDLSKKVVAYLNQQEGVELEIEFQEIEWSAKEALLENGTIDLVWNGMTITEERAANMCVSVPYLLNKQVAVIRATDVDTFDSAFVAQANVGAEAGSAGEEMIELMGIGAEYISSTSQLDALTALDNGTIDIAVIDSVMAGYYTSTGVYKDSLVIVEGALAVEEYGIAAKKGNEAFMSKINEALIALVETDYAEVIAQYGLAESVALTADAVNPYANATDNSWNDIVASGKIVIGYTVFAPIAYMA